MISGEEIAAAANRWQLQDHIIEKDYVLGWLLWGIARHRLLGQCWVLKGGAGIKKCYVDTHRYSQDLDFTVLPDGPWEPDVLLPIFREILEEIKHASGLEFSVQEPRFEVRPHGGSTEGRIYFIGPRGNPSPTAAKLDITCSEDLMRPPVLRPIDHPYADALPGDTKVRCYSLEELFAEKIRALGERHRPGDLYDIIYLFRRSDLHAEPELISEVLAFKCDFKGIPVPEFEAINMGEARPEVEKRWSDMLGRSLSVVPNFEDYWNELENFFAWLNGEDCKVELQIIEAGEAWSPPPLEWHQGQSELIEPIRFAATNRLLINLGYQSSYRLVEPYSLRLTRAGNVLFYAIKARERALRSYRLDRIQSVEVTGTPFSPMYLVEFTPDGRIPIPFTQRRRRFTSIWSSTSSRRYVIECAVCGKRFYRDRYSTRINPHKQKDSHVRCWGRHGYLV